MKYQIIVEKISENMFLAYSPVMNNLRACGESLDATLADMRRGFLCYLHDPNAEMDVVVKSRAQNPDHSVQPDNGLMM